jgi:monovalent cation:proton antiporter-2 (CPA2) family protein
MDHAAVPHSASLFLQALIFLAAAVIAVPLFKRLRLGAVVGYLVAGVLIGPQVLALFSEAGSIMQIAELGVVMFLFLIGLEMKPSRLWSMRRDIFGLGGAQMVLTGLTLMWVPMAFGRDFNASLIAGLGLAISSTAILMQVLAERGEVQSPHGQRAFAVSIFQDLTIVPLLALVAFLSPQAGGGGGSGWLEAAKIVGAIAAVVLAGRYLLNPLFRILANAGAREIMTAAALLVVIGAAMIMTMAGLSMAMGAFLAGVFLAESSFRHELEADIEPFRGILMGLFFISVGMTIDLKVVADAWWRLAIALTALIVLKSLVMYAIMRLFGHDHPQSVRVGLLLAQSGEFGFVLYAAAVGAGVMQPDHGSILVALVVLSMALSPIVFASQKLFIKDTAADVPEENFDGAKGSVLIIGFGRFGQVTSQMLLSEGIDVTLIDNDPEMIQSAGRFGFKVFYGDGTRIDVLRAAGGENARVIVVATDNAETTARIVETVRATFPMTKIHARAYDRRALLDLVGRQADFTVRETFESAVVMGRATLEALGLSAERTAEIEADVRARDLARLGLQQSQGVTAGTDKMHAQTPRSDVNPEPLIEPKREAKPLTAETAQITQMSRPAA